MGILTQRLILSMGFVLLVKGEDRFVDGTAAIAAKLKRWHGAVILAGCALYFLAILSN